MGTDDARSSSSHAQNLFLGHMDPGVTSDERILAAKALHLRLTTPELQETVDRNRYEFTVEGWDWNTVLEDEEMYIDVATGEKVHPCWVEGSDEGQVVG